MKCPFCGYQNIQGVDECDKCGEDLTAFDRSPRVKDRLEKSIAKNTLADLLTSEPAVVSPNTPIKIAIEHLAQENRSVLVVSEEKLVGIVTERDILFKVIHKIKDLEKTPVSLVMTPNPESLQSTDKIAYALNKMAIGGFRHIPIIDHGKKIRVVSVRDILAFLAEMFP